MRHPLKYRKPTLSQVSRLEALAPLFEELWNKIEENCPHSVERVEALKKIQEARMWANAAIVLGEDHAPQVE